MYDDEPFDDLLDHDDSDVDSARTNRRGNCLFLAISILLIITLIGSSVITLVLAVRNGGREATSASVARAISGPTAAPATVVAAVFPSLPSPDSVAAPDLPEVNRIAIINPDGQLETMSPTGADRRVLTSRADKISFWQPVWSPDGRHLAVIGNRSGGSGIYMLEDVPQVEARSLTDYQVYDSGDQPPFYLYWSPDGRELGYLAQHSRELVGLAVVSGDGAGASRTLAAGSTIYWDWSRDGRQMLAHISRNRFNRSLALIDIDGRTIADNLAVPGEFQAPGIERNGRYWAFAEQDADRMSALVVVDTQSGERQAYDRGGSLALGWSPTQDQIAFTHSVPDGHPLWGPLRRLDVATGEIRLLSSQAVLAFFWSPDGRSIAFITLSRDTDDAGINARQKDGARRVNRMAAAPAQQLDRGLLTLSVIDAESGAGLRLLDFQPTVGFLSQFLPYFDQYALSHRIWAPDSSAIVLPVREDDANRILIVPVNGERPYRLADGNVAFWSQN